MSVLESLEPTITQRLKKRYGNFIGGKFRPPLSGEYFENVTPNFRRGIFRGSALKCDGH